MQPGEMKLQVFMSVYYSFSVTVGVLTNLCLLFVMKTTKSMLLKDMKYYLFNTAVFEIIVSISTYYAQCRPVANEISLAVFCYGPCKHFGAEACFLAFAFVQCSVVAASFSILLSFYCRYRMLTIEVNKTYRHAKIFIVFSIFPISMLLFQLLTDADFEQVEVETKALHPLYDYEHNALIGFSNMRSVGSVIAQLMISLGVYVAPLIAFYYRRKINRILSKNTGQRIPVAYCKRMVNGLLIQTLIPFCVYIPPYSYFLYSKQIAESNIILEYILNIFGSFTAFLNPMLTFYFVLPYRRALCKRMFRYMPSVSEDGTDRSLANPTTIFQRPAAVPIAVKTSTTKL